MAKLRMNEIEVIVNRIINEANAEVVQKREDFVKNYKLTKYEKEFNKQEVLVQNARSVMRKLIADKNCITYAYYPQKEVITNFGKIHAIEKYPNSWSRTTLKENLILHNIDPLFNVDTFIKEYVKTLTDGEK